MTKYILKQKLRPGQEKTLGDVQIMFVKEIDGVICFALAAPGSNDLYDIISLSDAMGRYEIDHEAMYNN